MNSNNLLIKHINIILKSLLILYIHMQLRMLIRVLICGMGLIISTFMVRRKEIIPFGIVESLIIVSIKYRGSCLVMSGFGWRSIILMVIALMVSPPCYILIMVLVMDLLATIISILMSFLIMMLFLISWWHVKLLSKYILRLFWLLRMFQACLGSVDRLRMAVLDSISDWRWQFLTCG